MRRKDHLSAICVVTAVATDIATFFGAFLLATWIRFDSGLLAVPFGREPRLYAEYGRAAVVFALLLTWIFARLHLYARPQPGRFEDKIPRLVRACGLGTLVAIVLAFAVRNYYREFSAGVLALSFPTVLFCVLVERYLLFRLELHYARHSPPIHKVLLIGVGDVAARLRRGLTRDRKLRTEVVGFLRSHAGEPVHDSIPPSAALGSVDDLKDVVRRDPQITQVVLTGSFLDHARIVEIILFCERNLVHFSMVPDLFQTLTGSMNVQSVDEIPLLGIGDWPLDQFWNRLLKRAQDVALGWIGLIGSAPIIAVAALAIKRSSPGPVFFRQERCGENGRVFTLYKLRTMPVDAEAETGPVWAAPNDTRRTRVGAWLREWNLDELPQFWNVLKGDMSVVGPRPERPHFVEKFKSDIGRYMWRHVSKPGMTGWAQVNGLRGDTGIEERVKYDLFYLEHWSLSLDFKILVKTLLTRENAY